MANQILAGAVINAGMVIAGVDADNPPYVGLPPTPQNYFQASLSDWTIVAGSVSEPTSGTFAWTREGGSGWVAGYEVSGLTVGTEYTISYEMRKTGGPGPMFVEIYGAFSKVFSKDTNFSFQDHNSYLNWYENLDSLPDVYVFGQVFYTQYVLQILIAGLILYLAAISVAFLTVKTAFNRVNVREQSISKQLSRKNVL